MRTTTLLTLLVAPLALAACDSGQDTTEMNDMPMAEDGMICLLYTSDAADE